MFPTILKLRIKGNIFFPFNCKYWANSKFQHEIFENQILANYTVTNLSVKIIKKSKKLSGHTVTYILYVFLPPFLPRNNMRFYFALFNPVRLFL